MRLAFVHKRFSRDGGTERQLVQLCGDLAGEGHDVHVYCARARIPPPAGVALHAMPPIPMGSLSGLVLFSRWAARAVARDERRAGPYHVRAAFGRTLGQDVYRIGGGCQRTYLDHAHGLDRHPWLRRWLVRGPLRRMQLRYERRALGARPAPVVVTNSEMVRDDVALRYALPPDHVHVVPNGVDLTRFRPAGTAERAALRRRWALRPDQDTLVLLGGGYARKGLDPTLRALARLRRRRPDVVLLVVGGDRRKEAWRRRAAGLGVADRLRWLGHRGDPERCLRAADVLVLPSAYDPAANATLEALASGLPVVTSSMNGAGGLLDEGVQGAVLATPVDPGELADALDVWLGRSRDPAVRAAARERATRYPQDAVGRRMLEVLRRIVEDRV